MNNNFITSGCRDANVLITSTFATLRCGSTITCEQTGYREPVTTTDNHNVACIMYTLPKGIVFGSFAHTKTGFAGTTRRFTVNTYYVRICAYNMTSRDRARAGVSEG